MKVLVCVKRVPFTGGKMVLAPDKMSLETRHLGFTISPHEECGVEAAVRLVEVNTGESVVLTLGPPEAIEQLRDAMALGIDRAIHLQTDGSEWDPEATAAAIVAAIQGDETEQEADGGRDVYVVPMPAALTVKEGLNLPRYPSVPGRMRAGRKPVATSSPPRPESRLQLIDLVVPGGPGRQTKVLGSGPSAAPAVLEMLRDIGLV